MLAVHFASDNSMQALYTKRIIYKESRVFAIFATNIVYAWCEVFRAFLCVFISVLWKVLCSLLFLYIYNNYHLLTNFDEIIYDMCVYFLVFILMNWDTFAFTKLKVKQSFWLIDCLLRTVVKCSSCHLFCYGRLQLDPYFVPGKKLSHKSWLSQFWATYYEKNNL